MVLLIGGGVLAATGLVVGGALAIAGHVRVKHLKRTRVPGVSVAVTPSGAAVSWKLRF